MSCYGVDKVIDFLKKDAARVCDFFNRNLQQRTFEHPETTVVTSPWFPVVALDSDSFNARDIFTNCYCFAIDNALGILRKLSPWVWVSKVNLEVDPEQSRVRLEIKVIYE